MFFCLKNLGPYMVLEMLFEEFQVVNFLNQPCQRNVKTRILTIYSTKII